MSQTPLARPRRPHQPSPALTCLYLFIPGLIALAHPHYCTGWNPHSPGSWALRASGGPECAGAHLGPGRTPTPEAVGSAISSC